MGSFVFCNLWAVRSSRFNFLHFFKASLLFFPLSPLTTSSLVGISFPNAVCLGISFTSAGFLGSTLGLGAGTLSSALNHLDLLYKLAKLKAALKLFSCEFSMVFPK